VKKVRQNRGGTRLIGILAIAGLLLGGGYWAVNKSRTEAPKVEPKPVVYKPKPAPPKDTRINVPRPTHVRGIYVTAWSAGSNRKMTKLLELVDSTELNAMVIDVRDAGILYWKTGIATAEECGATRIAIVRPDALMQRLEKHRVYAIARIACFRDNLVPRKYPERGVLDAKGKPWKDTAGYTWLDPYNKENWEYIGKVVDFALDRGFQEIQLDYVRFPSEGTKKQMVFPSQKAFGDKAKFSEAIQAFVEFIGERVRVRHAAFSGAIFGIVSINKTDQGIGQSLEAVARPFDVVSPMVYPSHFARGEYGVKDPGSSPQTIVMKSLRDFSKRLPGKKLRPWLQDFFGYGKSEVQAQIRACKILGYDEYLLWNARNVYTSAAVKDNSGLVKRKV
jgi:hypothetical protein